MLGLEGGECEQVHPAVREREQRGEERVLRRRAGQPARGGHEAARRADLVRSRAVGLGAGSGAVARGRESVGVRVRVSVGGQAQGRAGEAGLSSICCAGKGGRGGAELHLLRAP